ncbi:MAG: AI-2E family transporter, partial [Fulvivirga sp.]|nr:AI-2E family transporter [Fulvivirga sp.]
VLASVLGFITLLYIGRTVLVPVAFSVLIAFILYPICYWLESKGLSRLWAILWTMLGVVILISGVAIGFSAQIINIVKEFGSFSERLNEILLGVTNFLNEKITIIPEISKDSLINMGVQWFSSNTGGMLTNTLNNTALFITGLTLTVIYTFLILLYRSSFTKAVVSFAEGSNQQELTKMIQQVQKVGQQYLTGMFLLIVILGVLNSLGLFIIGIEYALFFGFLAAFLAIIPYIGTTLGGAIPAIYALMHYDSLWYPLGVIITFWLIQLLEGNFLSPKIVGGNLNLNALAAILALISGGLIWGIPGMVLFLPYTAVFMVICNHFNELKPVGMLLKDEVNTESSGKSLISKIKNLF